MEELELFYEVLKIFNYEGFTIGSFNDDTKTGIVKLNNNEIGKIKIFKDVIIFSIFNEDYRVIKMTNGFQTICSSVRGIITYTKSDSFEELTYAFDDDRLVLSVVEDTINIEFVEKVSEKDDYDRHERRIALVNSQDEICYDYYEAYHTSDYSTNPVWYFGINTIEKKAYNWGSKGNKNYGGLYGNTKEIAKENILEHLESSKILNDIRNINEIKRSNLLQNFDETLENMLGSNKNK